MNFDKYENAYKNNSKRNRNKIKIKSIMEIKSELK